MPACPYLSMSWYKNTNCLFHISIELLLMFLIQKNLSSNIERRQKLEMLQTKGKMKNNYLYRCYYIHFKYSFCFIVCWIRQDDKGT